MFVRITPHRRFAQLLVAALIGAALLPALSVAEGDKPGDKPGEDPPAATEAAADRPAQQAMRKLVTKVEFSILGSEGMDARPLKLRPQPLVSYGDETRFIKDSTLWVWMDGDRPVLFQKLELNDWVAGQPQWTWCFASIAPDLVEGRWPSVTNRIKTKATVASQSIPGAAVSDNAAAWPLEARALNRRFAAEDGPNFLRGVARPVLEFKAPDQGVPYGAVFSHARGTNPDVLLILQVETTPSGERRWSFTPVHLTSAKITLKRDGEEVWTDPSQEPAAVSSWGYFFTPRDPAIK